MDSLQIKLETRKEYTDRLNNILFSFFVKFIKKLSKNIKPREFQIELFKIPKWSDKKQLKEYTNFLSYVNNKFDLSESNVIKIFEIIIQLNIEILNNLFIKENGFIMPKLCDLFYKSIKRIGKYYYENPLQSNNTSEINIIINQNIQKFIPLKDILDYKKDSVDSYNFNIYNQTTVSQISESKKNKINKIKNLQDDDLKYISSNEFENEYYNSNIDNNHDSQQEKQIDIKKVHKRN